MFSDLLLRSIFSLSFTMSMSQRRGRSVSKHSSKVSEGKATGGGRVNSKNNSWRRRSVSVVRYEISDSKGLVKRENRFASNSPANKIVSKIEESAKLLGFDVDKRNKMKLKGDKNRRKGQVSVATKVFEVAPSLHMVEHRKVGGDTLEFH